MNLKINIAFTFPDFRGGGAEKVMTRLINYISSLPNYQVYIFVGKKSGPNLNQLSKQNPINIIELGKSGLKAIPSLLSNIKKYNIDIIIGTLNMAHAVSLCNIFAPKNCTCIARLGNTISEEIKNYNGLKKIISIYYQKALAFSDVIVTQSEYMKHDLKSFINEKYHYKIKLIYNPIDQKNITDKSKEPSTISVSSDDIITIGRLEYQKNHYQTLRVFSLYNKAHPKSSLHIIGAGSLKNKLIELSKKLNIETNVIFHNYVENPYPLLKKCKMVVMASYYEGFSNVILECVALGVNIVASNCPGGNSEIINNNNGYLFDVDNDDDMYKKMLECNKLTITSPDVKQFSTPIIAHQYLELINHEK
ncbi:glycosyltransferase [Providencia rettgeri]|uniref:glycosyltransferase n=1 Tax=Providencia TaxID=586 RepID=UPI0023491EFF|nr:MULTISPECIES: glycosyltransferase [Providencia]MDH2397120.1 glycosyltransferase [Providencia rettgeri]